ncbi:hypothetical protein IVB27_36660 [Bradyrhizobium sp. 197]|uniref:hypothetical protein n=1 Tax=Bradyrhizobium sp. 197 TaxID=2782663 RepID=UPI001FFA0D50|nr:hypothetical protein [Bradyrhizobium sp. 197]MCK1480122.1 hypothetical protein [Bradyrhizobium sp. 197]
MDQYEWERLAKQQERLHPDLDAHLMETPHGLMLNHPLVQECHGFVDLEHAAILNQRYREKLQDVDEALAGRKWILSFTCTSDPIELLHSWRSPTNSQTRTIGFCFPMFGPTARISGRT